jgi:hypothetical protein
MHYARGSPGTVIMTGQILGQCHYWPMTGVGTFLKVKPPVPPNCALSSSFCAVKEHMSTEGSQGKASPAFVTWMETTGDVRGGP